MIGDAIALLDLVRKIRSDRRVLSALLDYDGDRLEGDDEIGIIVQDETHPYANDPSRSITIRLYMVRPIEGYEFVRLPVNTSAVTEVMGYDVKRQAHDARVWRYISSPDGLLKFGGPMPNAMVRFMVFGYRTADLLSLGKGQIA